MDGGGISGSVGDDSGKRERTRDSMFLQAELRPGGTRNSPAFTVKVRNISAGGMMGQSDQPLAAGDRIAVELRNIGRVDGTVAWVNADRFGVTFDNAVDPKLARQKLSSRRPGPQISGAGFRKVSHPLG